MSEFHRLREKICEAIKHVDNRNCEKVAQSLEDAYAILDCVISNREAASSVSGINEEYLDGEIIGN